MALPLAAHAGEAEGAQLELDAQAAQDGGVVAVVECAGEIIGPLSLLLEVDQVIGRGRRAAPGEGLGIDAGPEQGEVADVAINLAAGPAFVPAGFFLVA